MVYDKWPLGQARRRLPGKRGVALAEKLLWYVFAELYPQSCDRKIELAFQNMRGPVLAGGAGRDLPQKRGKQWPSTRPVHGLYRV